MASESVPEFAPELLAPEFAPELAPWSPDGAAGCCSSVVAGCCLSVVAGACPVDWPVPRPCWPEVAGCLLVVAGACPSAPELRPGVEGEDWSEPVGRFHVPAPDVPPPVAPVSPDEHWMLLSAS